MKRVDELEEFQPASRAQWRAWLAENHDRSNGVWFVYFKKSAGKSSLSYEEAVEEGLCYGWIDSLTRRVDDERTKMLFTPRKSKSVWSKPNKMRVERLIENGLMTAFGLAKIEEARANGSWNALDAVDDLLLPADLERAFAADERAKMHFDAFSKSVKRAILSWILSAKREETRLARVEKTVAMAATNKRATFDKETA